MEKLSLDQSKQLLHQLPNWKIRQGKLFRSYHFKTFNAAFGFMTQAALSIEKMDHHPDWFNSYNRIDITLSTHSVKGLTTLDFRLAEVLEKLAKPLLRS